MSTSFRSIIDKRSALVYIDDILVLANEKQETFELIKELHTIASRENLKLAPEKSFYMLLKVKVKLVTTQSNQFHPKSTPLKEFHHQKKRKMLCNFMAVLTSIQNSLKNFIKTLNHYIHYYMMMLNFNGHLK